MAGSVSHGTFADAAPANRRRYHSPARVSAAEKKRASLISAVLVLANRGNYRATAHELAELADVRRQSICRYFGSVDLLYRVVARGYWKQVPLPAPFTGEATKDAVWLVLVGKPRELS